MSARSKRVDDLEKAVLDYTGKERTRLENEVTVLKAILSGRTGGKGLETTASKTVAAVAYNDLNTFLNGA